jgi:hypothetical protein
MLPGVFSKSLWLQDLEIRPAFLLCIAKIFIAIKMVARHSAPTSPCRIPTAPAARISRLPSLIKFNCLGSCQPDILKHTITQLCQRVTRRFGV